MSPQVSTVYVQGHEPQKHVLRELSAHTLLFTGPSGVGRRQVARWYAALLNCQTGGAEPCGTCNSCRLFTEAPSEDQDAQHPDYIEVAPRTLTTTGRVSRRPEILISQLVPREGSDAQPLSRWLESRPMFNRRVGVIDSADTLNVSAANAFLKFLEEPPARVTIILIAPSPQAVLATIASRSSILRFGTTALDVSHPLARLGRVGDVSRSSSNPESFDDLNTAIRDYFNALPKGLELAFEAGDLLEKLWSNEGKFNVPELVLAHASKAYPQYYAAVADAVAGFEEALGAYSSSGLAMQVMTLELRERFA